MWTYSPGDSNGTTVNGVTYLSFFEQKVDDYNRGPSFVVPAGMNAMVFAEKFSGSRRVLPSSMHENFCRTLGADF